MGKSNISEQAEKYAEVIVGQIAGNFSSLHRYVDANTKVKEARKNFRESLPSNTNGKDFIEKVIDKTFSKSSTITKLLEAQDRLDKANIEKQKYSTYEPLAVGLFGEWGSGKTHQLKLIEDELYTNPLQENGWYTVPVFFNAWRFEKEEHIILPLFKTLLSVVENLERDHETTENIQQSWRSLKIQLKSIKASMLDGFGMPESTYNTALNVIQGNLVEAGMSIYDVKKVLKKSKALSDKKLVGEQSLTQLLKPDQLESIYLNIPKWIEEITLLHQVNFVFLIDDLDRCLPENTLKMLESIKLFLDVPSCAFVLAVDDDVVERGVVHHYRDYLQQNNNTIVYMDKKEVSDDNSQRQEPPITGHEYLEKMIQLPMRLPVIDTDNVRKFLEEHSGNWIEEVDREYKGELEEWEKFNKALQITDNIRTESAHSKDKPKKASMGILDFLSDAIPPKPRKIKRTAKLFESKIQLLHVMKLKGKCSYELLAKMTLLELFAPKILRFIQNNDYAETYKALYDFHYVNDMDERKKKNTLHDTVEIKKFIDKNTDYTQEHKDRYIKLIEMIAEHHSSRMVFDLSTVFSKSEEYEPLKVAIEYRESSTLDTSLKDTQDSTMLDEVMVSQLFLEDNPATWGATLRTHKKILTNSQIGSLIEIAKEKEDSKFNNLSFIANPEWVGQLSKYVDNDTYKILLKASHEARFKSIGEEKIQIDSFQVTFAEYDKYCEVVDGVEKPKDNDWGRGRRPVINVSWKDANRYIDWLNTEKLGAMYALPSKEQWEIACSKDSGKKWHFGNKEEELINYAWYSVNSEGKTHRVGELKFNDWKLYDMHGNVWEWCEDLYDEDKDTKVLKGGSWDNYAFITQTSNSIGFNPRISSINAGFRLLRTLH
ncbi:MAG TPA: hypothetical protein EYG82_03465 [Sulfurovum sp.]|nr:hypothetical protein [Sulfurovum sp.]